MVRRTSSDLTKKDKDNGANGNLETVQEIPGTEFSQELTERKSVSEKLRRNSDGDQLSRPSKSFRLKKKESKQPLSKTGTGLSSLSKISQQIDDKSFNIHDFKGKEQPKQQTQQPLVTAEDKQLAFERAQNRLKLRQKIEISKEGSKIPRYFFHGSSVTGAVAIMITTFQVLFLVRFFKVNLLDLFLYTVGMVPLGIGISFLYQRRRAFRTENREKLNLDLNGKGFAEYFNQPPTWVKMLDSEKCKWLNKILTQCWPYYDKAICDKIQEQVNPILNDFAFPPVRRLQIEKLRFGDSPIAFENVRTVDEGPQVIAFEIDVRWKGDTKIVLGIETYALGSVTPSVSNISFIGTIKIFLKPLVPVIPGIGAVVATFRRPPIIKFQLNFGALGGKTVAAAVRPVIDNILRDQLSNMLVWPNRMVVPLQPEEITGNLEYLKQNTQGVLTVKLIRGIGLAKMDVGKGSTDGYVEMFTQPDFVAKSKVVKNSKDPDFNETHYLLVQEPTDQCIRVTCYDVDLLNMSQVYKNGFNVFKGFKESFNAKSLVGRCAIDLKPICTSPGVPTENFYPLGLLDWSSVDGCGTGRGQLHLKFEYKRVEDLNPLYSKRGALIVYLKKGLNIQGTTGAFGGIERQPNPFAKLKCHSREFQSQKIENNGNPVWDKKFTWFEVDVVDLLQIRVLDDNGMIAEEIGYWDCDITRVIESRKEIEGKLIRGVIEEQFEIGDGPEEGSLELKIQYVSYY